MPTTLYTHATDDGYLLGAERNPVRYFHFDCEECVCETVTVDLDDASIDAICATGTSEQSFSDGYSAYSAMARAFIGEPIVTEQYVRSWDDSDD